MKKRVAIGIDLGGTNLKAVLLREDGEILKEISKATDDQAGASETTLRWKEAIYELVLKWEQEVGHSLTVGIAAPGLPAADHRSIAYMPGRLAGLENLDWAVYLGHRSATVINDAKAALIAERHFGAGKEHDQIAMLTLGTGVGGAILIDGRLYHGFLNRAGHLGHISLQTDAPAGIVRLPGTLEQAVGNATVAARSYGRYTATRELVAAYRAGDTWATAVWLEAVKKLAVGLCSIINVLAPELIILGGGITEAEDSLFKPLADFMDLYEWRPGGIATPIKKASLGVFAGAVGAAAFVMKELKNRPSV